MRAVLAEAVSSRLWRACEVKPPVSAFTRASVEEVVSKVVSQRERVLKRARSAAQRFAVILRASEVQILHRALILLDCFGNEK